MMMKSLRRRDLRGVVFESVTNRSRRKLHFWGRKDDRDVKTGWRTLCGQPVMHEDPGMMRRLLDEEASLPVCKSCARIKFNLDNGSVW